MAEFLPICDVLFNIISLTIYFCNVVFDVVLSWALYDRGSTYFTICLLTILISLIVSQIVSLRWYLRKEKTETRQIVVHEQNPNGTLEKKTEMTEESKQALYRRYSIIVCHIGCIGVFWRYAKLFVPVNLRTVKHEVRDLCILRLLHAFCEAAPMLLIQLHMFISADRQEYLNSIKLETLNDHFTTPLVQESSVVQRQQKAFKDLNIVAACMSLFSICWALASFSKHVRLQSVHRLVLTWLGVIFQFLWRLGTITSRVLALTIYSSVYGSWILLVIFLHWSSMFIWLLMSKRGLFHGENISKTRKIFMTLLVSFIYIFAYINLQENGHKQKLTTFYTIMFLENCLLVFLWAIAIWIDRPPSWQNVPVLVIFSFFIGIFFMLIYYRYFHVRRLEYESGGRITTLEKKNCNHQPNSCQCSESLGSNCNGSKLMSVATSESLKYPNAIPGVFNCRFSNPVSVATKRKKKKPTTFVPPPEVGQIVPGENGNLQQNNGPMAIPFWKRALPRSHTGNSSENDASSVGSKVNIQQKLQEKKQKQLAELKVIEEEIKSGKLTLPKTGTMSSNEDHRSSMPRQPIPRNKRHGEMPPIDWRSQSPDFGTYINNYDQIYSAFGINAVSIAAALAQKESASRHASPATVIENNSLTRQVAPKTKMPRNSVIANMYPDGQPPSISPRNTSGNVKKNRPSPCPVAPPNTYSMESTGSHGRSSKVSSSATGSANNSNTNTVVHTQAVVNTGINTKLLQQRQLQRIKTQTPEVLLSPHYLENTRIYYEWMGRQHQLEREQPIYRIAEHGRYMLPSSGDDNIEPSGVDEGQSDIDSQISLPRSYTLPREFKYYRKNRRPKTMKNNIQSTNSSDGDVDSCDDNDSIRDSRHLNYVLPNNRQVTTGLDLLNGHALPTSQRTSRFRIYPSGFRSHANGPRPETKL